MRIQEKTVRIFKSQLQTLFSFTGQKIRLPANKDSKYHLSKPVNKYLAKMEEMGTEVDCPYTEETIDSLRQSGERFDVKTLLGILNREVEGREFNYNAMLESVNAELRKGTLNYEAGEEEGSWLLYFETEHPLNKYPMLRPRSLRDMIVSGEILPTRESE
jgi:hypothetical protein